MRTSKEGREGGRQGEEGRVMGNTNQTSKKSSKKKKVMSPIEQSGAPLAAAMLGELGGAGEMDTEDEEEGGSEREFDEPLCALVKNCNMLHNIVGPACIFLRQGFAQSQLVCIYPHYKHTTQTLQNCQNCYCQNLP